MTRDSGRSSLSWLSRLSPFSRLAGWNGPTGQRANGQAQSTVETALLLTVVAVALVVFFSFIRSAVSSRVKVGADAFGHGLLHDGN